MKSKPRTGFPNRRRLQARLVALEAEVARQSRQRRGGDRDQMTTYAKYPQVVFAVDFSSRMLLAAVPGRARGSDLVQFGAALRQAVLRARIGTFLADTDFDAE